MKNKLVRYVRVTGLITRERIETVAFKNRIEIILLNPRFIFGKDHIESAIEHAVRSFKANTNIANSIGIETVRYASCERQISTALSKMCFQPNSDKHILLIVGACNVKNLLKSLGLKKCTFDVESNLKNLSLFGFTDTELATLDKTRQKDLVLERIAMLDIDK